MAVYKIKIGTDDRLLNDGDIEDSRRIAKSKCWNPENIVSGDWIRYPETGFPRRGTPEYEAYKEPVIDIDYSRASIPGELPSPTGEERFGATEPVQEPTDTGGWTAEQTGEFEAYLSDVRRGIYPNLPVYDTIEEFWAGRMDILLNEGWYFSQAPGTKEQWDLWQRYGVFGGKYGDPDDYYAENWPEFIKNYDKSIGQLKAWEQEAGPEATGFTDDEIRRYKDYQQWYYEHGEPGDPMPVDPGDYIANEDMYQGQQATWEQEAAEAEQYEVSPAEAAKFPARARGQ